MKRRHAMIALPVIVGGTILAGSSQASAREIEPDPVTRPAVVIVDQPGPTRQIAVDDTFAETLQTSAGAVAGAGLATAGLWLYRRRHPMPAH